MTASLCGSAKWLWPFNLVGNKRHDVANSGSRLGGVPRIKRTVPFKLCLDSDKSELSLEFRLPNLNGLEDTAPVRSKLAALGLTPKQREIVVHTLRGLSNQQIAERLFISQQTVKDHLHDIYHNVGCQ